MSDIVLRTLVISSKGGVGKSFFTYQILAPMTKLEYFLETDLYNKELDKYENSFTLKTKKIQMGKKIKELPALANIDVGAHTYDRFITEEQGLISIFDIAFIPVFLDETEIRNALITKKHLIDAGMDRDNIYVVINKYDDTDEQRELMEALGDTLRKSFKDIIIIPTVEGIANINTFKGALLLDYLKIDEKEQKEIKFALAKTTGEEHEELMQKVRNIGKAKSFYNFVRPQLEKINLLKPVLV